MRKRTRYVYEGDWLTGAPDAIIGRFGPTMTTARLVKVEYIDEDVEEEKVTCIEIETPHGKITILCDPSMPPETIKELRGRIFAEQPAPLKPCVVYDLPTNTTAANMTAAGISPLKPKPMKGLKWSIGLTDDGVGIEFGEEIAWASFPASDARSLARHLLHMADEADRRTP